MENCAPYKSITKKIIWKILSPVKKRIVDKIDQTHEFASLNLIETREIQKDIRTLNALLEQNINETSGVFRQISEEFKQVIDALNNVKADIANSFTNLNSTIGNNSKIDSFKDYFLNIKLDYILEDVVRRIEKNHFAVETEYPLAGHSNDHLYPHGTMEDDTHSFRFVHACEKALGKARLKFLDIGCAGGGIVADFLFKNHIAIGLEGSNYSLLQQRAAWKFFSNTNLFTADVSKKFSITLNSEPFEADIISAWELLEHLEEESLEMFFENVRRHLSDGGFFIGSIATVPDNFNNIEYHRTIHDLPWWRDKFAENGLRFLPGHPFLFEDFCRGSGNIIGIKLDQDSNFKLCAENGFHFVAAKAAQK